MGGHGKGEAHIHAAGISFDRCIEEFFDFREGDNFIELPADLGFAHAENGAVQKNIFAPGQFRMKSGADLKQARNSSLDANLTFGRVRDATEDL